MSGCDALKTNWAAWHIYFGDERCLPAADPERNSTMARDAWLDHVPVPKKQVYAIPAEMGAKAAAAAYSATLQQVGEFDLVLLGLGEDGHTASLFPGNDWGQEADSPVALPVFDAPKAPAERVSLSAWRLSQAKQVLFLVTGESKHEAVMNWRAGANIPARAITPLHGVDVLAESVLLKGSRTAAGSLLSGAFGRVVNLFLEFLESFRTYAEFFQHPGTEKCLASLMSSVSS